MSTTIKLRDLLKRELPGTAAHQKMHTGYRKQLSLLEGEDKAVQSAVLLLLFPNESGALSTVFTLRPTKMAAHSGQISLPGGRYEESDPSYEATALRETYEEIGVDPSLIEIVGRLSEVYIPRSGYNVHPFVGYTPTRPIFTLQPDEVEQLIEIDLAQLFAPTTKSEFTFRDTNGEEFLAPSYLIDRRHLWGATAMMMAEFETIYSEAKF